MENLGLVKIEIAYDLYVNDCYSGTIWAWETRKTDYQLDFLDEYGRISAIIWLDPGIEIRRATT